MLDIYEIILKYNKMLEKIKVTAYLHRIFQNGEYSGSCKAPNLPTEVIPNMPSREYYPEFAQILIEKFVDYLNQLIQKI